MTLAGNVIEQALLDAENGNPERIRDVVTDAPTWHTPYGNLLGGDHMGREQLVHFLEESSAFTDRSLMIEEVRPMVLRGDAGSMRIRARAKHGTRSLDAEAEVTVKLENGRVAELWTRPIDVAAWDRFWSP